MVLQVKSTPKRIFFKSRKIRFCAFSLISVIRRALTCLAVYRRAFFSAGRMVSVGLINSNGQTENL